MLKDSASKRALKLLEAGHEGKRVRDVSLKKTEPFSIAMLNISHHFSYQQGIYPNQMYLLAYIAFPLQPVKAFVALLNNFGTTGIVAQESNGYNRYGSGHTLLHRVKVAAGEAPFLPTSRMSSIVRITFLHHYQFFSYGFFPLLPSWYNLNSTLNLYLLWLISLLYSFRKLKLPGIPLFLLYLVID